MLFSENINIFNYSARTLQTNTQTDKHTDRITMPATAQENYSASRGENRNSNYAKLKKQKPRC